MNPVRSLCVAWVALACGLAAVAAPRQASRPALPPSSATATATATASSSKALELWDDPVTSLQFVKVRGGCFDMGSDEVGEVWPAPWGPLPPKRDELGRHPVCVGDVWMSTTEVTRLAWNRVMDRSAPTHAEWAHWPKVMQSRQAVLEYLSRAAQHPSAKWGYRLPTEAEWEWACQGADPDHPWSQFHERSEALIDRAVFREPKREEPRVEEVATKAPTGAGLFDILGNVWELVADDYAPDAYLSHAARDPLHRNGSGKAVIRGGSYRSDVFAVRCAGRNWVPQDEGLDTVGFRLVKVMREKP